MLLWTCLLVSGRREGRLRFERQTGEERVEGEGERGKNSVSTVSSGNQYSEHVESLTISYGILVQVLGHLVIFYL